MTYCVAFRDHESDAHGLCDRLTCVGIPSTVRTTFNGLRIIFVARKHGRKAEAIAKEKGA
jgi:hypothetical protein